MHERHEPDKQFVDNLEWQIGGEIRRRNRAAAAVSPLWRMARVAAVVFASMGLGAVAMAASYQLEESWRKELLVAGLEVRVEIARQRLALAEGELEQTDRQVEVGVTSEETRSQTRLTVAAIEADLARLLLDLEEVRVSGREPRNDIAAPLVGGRDFVSERLQLQIDLVNRHLDVVIQAAQQAQRRRDAGVDTRTAAQHVQAELRGVQAQRSELRGRLTFREGYLAGEISALEAELYLLRAEAERKAESIRGTLAAVATEVEDTRTRVAAGLLSESTLQMVELGLAEMEAELRLAELEMQIVQRQLDVQRQERR